MAGGIKMKGPDPGPETVNRLRFAADAAFAMLAGLELDLFTPLKAGPMTAEQITDAIGVGSGKLRVLLYALVAGELLTEKEGLFSNTPEANQFLVKGAPSYMGHLHRIFSDQWPVKLKTAQSIRTGVPQAQLDFSHSPQEELEAFLRTINVSTVATARALLERHDFSSTQTLADVGSGAGGLAITIAKACPHLQATAIDLPLVTPIAQKLVEEEGAVDRVNVLAADVTSGPLPGSYDAAVLKGLLQILSPEEARLAVKNIAAAINPGGTIYIVGSILDDSRTSPPDAVGFNLVFINRCETGESYTEQEHRDWLSEAGFVDINRANFLLAARFGLITAQKGK